MNNDELRHKMIHFLIEYEKRKLCLQNEDCAFICESCPFRASAEQDESIDLDVVLDSAYEIIMEVMKNGYVQR